MNTYEQQKNKVLEDGGYTVLPHKIFQELLPKLLENYKGRDVRDALTLFLYLHAHVNNETKWAFPNFNALVKDTGIHRSRISDLIKLLEKEGLIETEKITYNGREKRRYRPYFYPTNVNSTE